MSQESTPAEPPEETVSAEEAQARAETAAEAAQRRENVRVDVQYPVVARVPDKPDAELRTRNISATGCAFATRLPLQLEDRFEIEIQFPEWLFTAQCVVKFVRPLIAGSHLGVMYEDLSDDERERMVKEVFAAQRAALKQQRV